MKRTHGQSNTRLYRVWKGMRERCYSKNHIGYKFYGGRGITVCEEWKNSYETFRDWALENGYDETALFGECTLDRIDANGNYEPKNCRFVNIEKQNRNKRSNTLLEYNGQTKTIAEWSDITGLSKQLISSRHNSGWSPERIFTTPLKNEQILYNNHLYKNPRELYAFLKSNQEVKTNYRNFYERIKRGYSIEESIEESVPRFNSSKFEWNGKQLTLKRWAKELNIPYGTLHARIYRYNWPIDKAFAEPINEKFRSAAIEDEKIKIILSSKESGCKLAKSLNLSLNQIYRIRNKNARKRSE